MLAIPADVFVMVQRTKNIIEIKSRSTSHYWKLYIVPAVPGHPYCVILLHKYRWQQDYHFQGHFRDVIHAIKYIMGHDSHVLGINKR